MTGRTETDPMLVARAIAAGICMAATQLAERDVLTADEAAELLRLDRKTVYDYGDRGVIPCQRVGKRMLFSRAALHAWLGANVSTCCKRSSNGDAT